jgi:hypothetical protein
MATYAILAAEPTSDGLRVKVLEVIMGETMTTGETLSDKEAGDYADARYPDQNWFTVEVAQEAVTEVDDARAILTANKDERDLLVRAWMDGSA